MEEWDRADAVNRAIYASYCSNALGAQYTPESVEQAAAPTAAAVPGGLSIGELSSWKYGGGCRKLTSL